MELAKLMHRTSLVALVTAAGAFGGASTALAQSGGCTGAPGASAIQQYCEAVPNADGSSDHGSGKKSSGSGVSSSTQKALSADGADGAAVSRLADATPSSSSSSSTSSDNASKKSKAKADSSSSDDPSATPAPTSVAVTAPDDPSGSPLKAATKAASNGPTAGGGIIWGVVAMSAIGGLAAVIIRRRPGQGFDPPSDDS